MSHAEDYLAEVQGLRDELIECSKTADKLNRHERIFGLAITPYRNIKRTIASLEPHLKLWNITADWVQWKSEWMVGEFLKLNPEEIRRNMEESLAQIEKLVLYMK